MNENVDHNPPISANELKIEFGKLKKAFNSDSPSDKIDATADMLVLVSRYLGNNIPSFDATPISIVLGEIAHIRNCGEPDFIKSEKTEGGRPKDVVNQMKTASIVVAIDIMSRNGCTVAESIGFVAKKLGYKEAQIQQLRADFNRRKMLSDVEEFKKEQSSIDYNYDTDVMAHVLNLLNQAKR